jgi:DNA-binding beta-propeller fold protein YncE
VRPAVGPVRATLDRQGSAVALARQGDRTLAYVADADSRAIHTVDIDNRTEVATTPLPGAPSQLLVLADGRIAATLRDTSTLAILEPEASFHRPLELRCTAKTPAEPFGLASTPDDARLLVTSAWDAKLTVLDARELDTLFSVDVNREPRAVLVDDTGDRAFVSHAVGSDLSVIDLAGKHDLRKIDMRMKKSSPRPSVVGERMRSGSQGFALAKAIVGPQKEPPRVNGPPPKGAQPPAQGAERPSIQGSAPPPVPMAPAGRIFVPMVTVDPGDPMVRSRAYYGEAADGIPKEAPVVSVIDAAAERSMTRTKLSLGTRLAGECLLPRAASFRAKTQTLLVACAGIDAIVELDTRGTDPIRLEQRRFSVPGGPVGMAIDDRNDRAVVWSQFEGKLSVVQLDNDSENAVGKIDVSYRPTADVRAMALGRQLFHLTDDSRIANDGVACASCHPDGREDALTWSTPDGPRQTIMLAGRTPETAPYGWVGKHGDLNSYVKNTFSRLGGRGLTGDDLTALVTYLERLPGPVAPSTHEPSLVERGEDLFFAELQGCAGCHVGGPGTDKKPHDVGSEVVADGDVRFDTPSLRFVKGTAPYFHDGRFATLDQMLAATESDMGHTAHLGQRDREALKAYLEGL